MIFGLWLIVGEKPSSDDGGRILGTPAGFTAERPEVEPSMPGSPPPRFLHQLEDNVVSIRENHRTKILKYFDRFLLTARKRGRILVASIQRILGF